MLVSFKEKEGVIIVELAGEIRLTEDHVPSLRKLITEQLAAGKLYFLLDFEKVEFIDSYGIGDIVAAYIAVRQKKGELKLANLSQKIWLIFHYSGLTRVLEMFDSREKALKSFS
jgi:anti-sigma B factor antagonist